MLVNVGALWGKDQAVTPSPSPHVLCQMLTVRAVNLTQAVQVGKRFSLIDRFDSTHQDRPHVVSIPLPWFLLRALVEDTPRQL